MQVNPALADALDVENSSPISAASAVAARAASSLGAQPLHRRPGRFGRSTRILVLLTAVWILSSFDLVFTVAEADSHHFVELNPIAARLLNEPPHFLALFKFGLLGVGTLILYGLRRHFIAELGCWFLLAACSYVGVRWYVYYTHVYEDLIDPCLDTVYAASP